jgi:MSHA pilin protein MshA
MNMMTQMAARKEKGFTLIELVMVIVILGILAAFALPRFADLGGDARASTLQGANGSVKSAAAIAHSAWLADGSSPATVTLDGAAAGITMSPDGYPTSDDVGIGEAAQINDDFTLTPGADVDSAAATIEAQGATGTCEFDYDPTTGSTTGLDDSGC